MTPDGVNHTPGRPGSSPVVHSNGTRSNSRKLEHRKSCTNMWKDFFTVRVMEHWNTRAGCPGPHHASFGADSAASGQPVPVLHHSHRYSWCSEGTSCVLVCACGLWSWHRAPLTEPGSTSSAPSHQILTHIDKVHTEPLSVTDVL